MAIPIISGILSLAGTAGELFKNWQDKKLIQARGKIEIENAKIQGKIAMEQKKATGDIDYNKIAAEGMRFSFKDELLLITWLSILVGSFLPWTQPYVQEGFIFLKSNTPYWFEYSLLGMVAASFGLKGWQMWKK